nr:integrase, catalytic region, zinc finger, CCHC-type, peptidase aspartic, catalytic [Tanacetum cinerariifolium]
MTGNLKLLINFVEKFLGTVKFGNDQIAPVFGYGDLVQGAVTIKRVYYVEGLNHNLFSVGQFCDADLEVAFRKSTCFIRDLKGNDLLTGSRGLDFYSITLQDSNSPNPICLMAKATSSQAWLWHRRLSHLNFDTINLLSKNDIVVGLSKLKFIKDHLYSSFELGKAKRRDGENLDKMKEKGDECIFVGYSTQSRAYKVFNNRTRVIIESIHVNFDELPHMASDQLSFDPVPECQTMVMSKSSAVSAADAPNQRQQHTTPLNIHTTHVPTCQVPTLAPTVISSENINQAETYVENDQVVDDEFINIFSTPVQNQGETSSHHVDSLNMHTFYWNRSVFGAAAGEELEEILVTHSPYFQNTSEPSNASTNVVNAPREPCVVKQDNGSFVDEIIFDINRAPDSPNQFHCFHCKDVLRDGEACKRCTCAKCGSGLSKGLCYICGHNQNSLNDSPRISETSSQSPPNINHCCYECVPVISIPEPCNNQTIDDLPQALPNFHPTFHSEAESPFTLDSTPTYVDESPNIFHPPLQPSVLRGYS